VVECILSRRVAIRRIVEAFAFIWLHTCEISMYSESHPLHTLKLK
jgi:hypothetical protein